MNERDPALDALLDLDGQTFFIDREGRHWVKFEVRRCDVSDDRPHGLRYSLTLHDASGRRLVGFDNAHPISTTGGPARRSKQSHDHKHRIRTIQPYDYQDASTLLGDF